MICTPTERDLIVAGATQLVVLGDHPDWCSGNPHESECECWDTPRVAPQRWVDATGPCPKCDGTGLWFFKTGGIDPDGNPDPEGCPDCIDGRKREALQVECPLWGAEPIQRHSCRHCDRGYVTFAYATVEVLPVSHDLADPGLHVWWTGAMHLLTNGDPLYKAVQLTLNPLPVPGRDWVVLLDNVELT